MNIEQFKNNFKSLEIGTDLLLALNVDSGMWKSREEKYGRDAVAESTVSQQQT